MFICDYCGNYLYIDVVYGDENGGAEVQIDCSCGAKYTAFYALQGVELTKAPDELP